MPKAKIDVKKFKSKLNISIAELTYKDNQLQSAIYTAKKSIEEQRGREDQKALLKAKVESLIRNEQIDMLYQMAVQTGKETLQQIAMFEKDPLAPQAIYYLTVIQNLAPCLDSDAYREIAKKITKQFGELPKNVLSEDLILTLSLSIDPEYLEERINQLFQVPVKPREQDLEDLEKQLRALQD